MDFDRALHEARYVYAAVISHVNVAQAINRSEQRLQRLAIQQSQVAAPERRLSAASAEYQERDIAQAVLTHQQAITESRLTMLSLMREPLRRIGLLRAHEAAADYAAGIDRGPGIQDHDSDLLLPIPGSAVIRSALAAEAQRQAEQLDIED